MMVLLLIFRQAVKDNKMRNVATERCMCFYESYENTKKKPHGFRAVFSSMI